LSNHEENPFGAFFNGWSDMEADTAHFMENLRDHYNIPLEQVTIIENMDNCIDEPGYSKIEFLTSDNLLIIKMFGTGIPSDIFFDKFRTIAATTKNERKGLGHYGWGMKVSLWVANPITIKTKKGDFVAAQEWILTEAHKPRYRIIPPPNDLNSDMTVIELKLINKYQGKLTKEVIRKILQTYYPTLLNGYKVMGRSIEVFVDNEKICWNEPKYTRKEPLCVNTKHGEVTGYLYYNDGGYDDNTSLSIGEEKGMLIIIYGRAIKIESFNQNSNKITGYIHSDILSDSITADKTTIRKDTLWWDFHKKVGAKIQQILEKIGISEEEKLYDELDKVVNRELNNVIRDFETFFNEYRGKITLQQQTPKINQLGELTSFLEKGGTLDYHPHTDNFEPAKEKEKNVGEPNGNPNIDTPNLNEAGPEKLKNVLKKKKFGIQFKRVSQPNTLREAWFNDVNGVIFVNIAFPTYQRAKNENKKTETYHCLRASFEAITEYMMEKRDVNLLDQFLKQRNEILLKWGEKWQASLSQSSQ
jgi:hypothetical protein